MTEERKENHQEAAEETVKEERPQELGHERREEIAHKPAEEKDEVEELKRSLAELNEKYLRLYAEFENYKKFEAKKKEELINYSNEGLMKELLTVIDNLELALQHSSDDKTSSALAEGVELTLKELKTILERHGLVSIDAQGKPFDPYLHHAMSQVETDEVEENIVVKEFRKGYKLRDRVIRAALVGVSKRPAVKEEKSEDKEE
jgi:molecular chaperone GrpE